MKKSALLATLLSCVYLIGSTFGLVACTDKLDNSDNVSNTDNGGDAVTVIKVGESKIGTVTADGVTYNVEGVVDTVYKVTANVNDAVCNDVEVKLTVTNSTVRI